MQKPHEVTQSKIGIQIGRTIVSLAVKHNDSAGNSKVQQQNVTVMDVKEFDTMLKDHSGENRKKIKKNLFYEIFKISKNCEFYLLDLNNYHIL